jgi:hypothetical protein
MNIYITPVFRKDLMAMQEEENDRVASIPIQSSVNFQVVDAMTNIPKKARHLSIERGAFLRNNPKIYAENFMDLREEEQERHELEK